MPQDLLPKLADHFSSEYDHLIHDLDKLQQDLKSASAESLDYPQAALFYTDLMPAAKQAADTLTVLMEARCASFDLLLMMVDNKKTKAFTPTSIIPVADNASGIHDALTELDVVIIEHNKRTTQFDQYREAAFVKLEKHWASRFVINQKYTLKIQQVADSKVDEMRKLSMRDELVRCIGLIERELSEAVKGAETINDLMHAYFGKDDLRITVAGDRFRITRSGAVAKNLSEGERSAVAFVHFMTRLLDGKHPLSETTVIIDDPIGSLDANHLFNTYAFIKTKLCDCYQLFVLTHNYEFYSLVKEWALSEKANKADKPQTAWKKWSVYLVRRTDDGKATIGVIPPELLKFKSEYHYLFSTMHNFINGAGANYDYLFSLPNITRRFMEAFGGIMIPTWDGLHGKLPRLIPDQVQQERVWKFINDYSHNTSVNRSLVIPDVSECRAVVSACLKAVEDWNATYFRDLVEAVK